MSTAPRGLAAVTAKPNPTIAMPKTSTNTPSNAPARRPLDQLVNNSDPGWPVVAEMIAKATNKVEVLPAEPARGEQALLAIQVSTRSPMGAIAYGSGGLFVDDGWIRLLGGGHPRLPRDIGTWNFPKGFDQPQRLAGAMLIADDVLGGFFAVNGGAFDGPLGNVFYLPPDSLQWEDLERGYRDFLEFLFVGDLAKFYDGQRWDGWPKELETLPGDRAYAIYPFLWSKEGGTINQRRRKDVPIEELWNLHAVDLPKQLAGVPGGSKVKIIITK